MIISKRVRAVKPSATLAISAKAKALKSQGVDVISFSAGEPDFDTPLNIKEAAKKAIDQGYTKYCPVPGSPEVKQAIIDRISSDYSINYNQNEIIVSCGAKHSLFNLFLTILNPGDHILVPSPYWVSYPDMALLAGATAKFIKTSQNEGFKITPEKLKKAITKKSKAIVINSPSNPTGSAYTKEELEAICGVCVKNKLLIIADEIYDKLVYDGIKYTSIPSISNEIKENTILVNGVSKAYSMTGWRIGYAAGNKDIIAGMSKIQSQSTSNPASISLKAAVEAYNGPQDEVEKMRAEFEKRRDYIVKRLNSIKGVSCMKPQGAFYVFPKIKKLLGKTYKGVKVNSSIDFADYLLDKAHIAVVPGDPFGAPGHIRLSYAASMEDIKTGIDRFEEAIR